MEVCHYIKDFFVESWKPLTRTEGKSLVEDALFTEGNFRKVAARTYQVSIGVLLGMDAMLMGTILMVSFPVVSIFAILGLGAMALVGLAGYGAAQYYGDDDVASKLTSAKDLISGKMQEIFSR